MIRVQEQPAPIDFAQKVLNPGKEFLKRIPHPAHGEWKAFWQEILPDLYTAYNGVCAYSAHWIPRSTGTASVDHFIPKREAPELAYEWSNYRLASLLMNSRKRDFSDVADPFRIQPNWFVLEFPSLHVSPNRNLSTAQAEAVKATINRLKLNEEYTLVADRLVWVLDFRDGIPLDALKRRAPFIAYELERQGLADRNAIASVMRNRAPTA